MNKIHNHIKKSQSMGLLLESDYDTIQLPAYIINLKQRKDRLHNIMEEFRGKDEFNVHIIEACRKEKGALRHWKSIKTAIQLVKKRKDEVVLICEEDHGFCQGCHKQILFFAEYQGAYLGADIILGGISQIEQVIPINDYFCWIDSYQCTQLTMIYHYFFDAILEEEFRKNDKADLKLSAMTPNKYVINPFISNQKDFGNWGIDDNTTRRSQYKTMLSSCEAKINIIRQKTSQFTKDNADFLSFLKQKYLLVLSKKMNIIYKV